MTACLTDRMLWALSEGDGTHDERDHLAHCRLCADRARAIRDDLTVIGSALRRPEPVATDAARDVRTVAAWGMASALAVLAVAALVFARPAMQRSLAQHDGVAALVALSTDVFAEDTPADVAATDVEVVASAFEAAGPCEWEAGGCQDR